MEIDDIQDKKLELIQWLSTLDDLAVIEKLLALRNSEKLDWWNELSATEKKSIDKGIEDADNKKLVPDAKAKEIYGKWL
ncbi:hypothetical protein HX109_09465 [Galbibacter sp. BG1]|uniref:hypothetical protein n=1 Tax=Galbibacter sp. BG1 TaxID=1170699 RepID=UPI0015B96D39|nr:hypothetical protein [Galbibacter sp. BG1]QLE01773.1 hypothetical protein HX109_09465 [Galbibacter sp. BG1]